MSNNGTDMTPSPQPSHTARTEASNLRWHVEHDGVPVAESSAVLLVHEHVNGTDLAPVPYFPISDVRPGLLKPSDHTTRCPVKGTASYYSVRLDDNTIENGVWTYPEPLNNVAAIVGHVGFYGDRFAISAEPSDIDER